MKLFISRAGEDADFAAVVGTILESAGHSVILQQWDFANRNFVERMHSALGDGARVVALLSPEYLRSDYCQAEWQNAIADDPLNTKSRLILLRVGECEPVGLLRGLAYWDLVPIRDNRELLERAVLDAVREDRPREAAIGPYWRAPRTIVDAEAIRPVLGFSGRAEELDAIAAALESEGSIAAVHGLAGAGKSSVAREYAWRNRERYAVIWWINAEREDAIVEGFLRLGALFARGLEQQADRRAAAMQVIATMLSGFAKPILLVFDNLEDERLLNAWLPRSDVRVLITSRNASWGRGVVPIGLTTWPLQTATTYLQQESGRDDLTDADAGAIAQALGALPLALSHAAAALRGMRMVTPQRYLGRIGEHLKNAPRNAEYPSSVFATFKTSIAQADHQAAGAAAILSFAAGFAPDAIPEELFAQPHDRYSDTLDLRSTVADELRLDAALGALDRLSLLSFSAASRTYAIHRLVQLAARDAVGDEREPWQRNAVAVADAAFPDVAFETWSQCERLLPHARAALEALPAGAAFPAAGRLAHESAVYLRERADYEGAERLQLRALAIREASLGAQHRDVATSLDDLAILYYFQGRYEEAEPLYKRALQILRNVLGPNDREVAVCLNSLACSYYAQARYEEAEAAQTGALTIWENALGPEHPNIGRALGNLAGIQAAQTRYADAEAHASRALVIAEKALGPDHPLVAIPLNNVAEMHYRLGRYAESEQLIARALAIWEKAGVGPEHPDVAISLNVLGRVYEAFDRLDEAESAHRRALAIREKALGVAHPATADSLSNLASVLFRRGRFEEAESAYARALTIRESALAPDHPDLVENLTGLAEAYEARGRASDAESLRARAAEITR